MVWDKFVDDFKAHPRTKALRLDHKLLVSPHGRLNDSLFVLLNYPTYAGAGDKHYGGIQDLDCPSVRTLNRALDGLNDVLMVDAMPYHLNPPKQDQNPYPGSDVSRPWHDWGKSLEDLAMSPAFECLKLFRGRTGLIMGRENQQRMLQKTMHMFETVKLFTVPLYGGWLHAYIQRDGGKFTGRTFFMYYRSCKCLAWKLCRHLLTVNRDARSAQKLWTYASHRSHSFVTCQKYCMAAIQSSLQLPHSLTITKAVS